MDEYANLYKLFGENGMIVFNILSFFLVIAGFLLMIINVRFNSKIYDNHIFLSETDMKRIDKKIKIHKILMIVFVLGYLFVGIKVICNDEFDIGTGITCFILFLGSIFVYIGIRIQDKMLSMISKTHLQLINSLVRTIECRDEYTCGHSEHVANLCRLMCKDLNIKGRRSSELYFAALLHDVGKIGVPEGILNKTSELNKSEYKEIKKHVAYSRNIIGKIDGFGEITNWILYHHERVDGKGYYGILGDEIPMEAKIIAVADTFSALVTDRPYRKGVEYFAAVKIIKECSGNQLETMIVNTLLDIPKEEIDKCIPKRMNVIKS